MHSLDSDWNDGSDLSRNTCVRVFARGIDLDDQSITGDTGCQISSLAVLPPTANGVHSEAATTGKVTRIDSKGVGVK